MKPHVADSPGSPTAMTVDTLAPATTVTRSLLDAVLDATGPAGEAGVPGFDIQRFLAEPSPVKCLAHWIDRTMTARPTSKEQVTRLLNRDVARLDALLERQVNAILHHPDFQRLEASWRGLRYLIDQVPEGENVKVRVLSVSWKEVVKDLEKAIEFDQSQLFRKVYGEEFGSPGGEPYGVLLGDYTVHHRPSADHPTDDVGALTSISAVAAAAFAPFLTAPDPSLLDLGSFTELERPLNLTRVFEQRDYTKWRAFRATEDARFVGLVLPRVLMRLPYMDQPGRVDGFRFREDVEGPDRSKFLWGNAVYAFGAVLVQAFAACGWLADIRGVRPGVQGQGLVTGLPVHSFRTDRAGIAPRCSTDAQVHEYREKELSELGFIPLCHCPDTELSAFYSNQSVQRPRKYDEAAATANANLSSMLQYVLCVSRFAHFLKVIGRDMLGSLTSPGECEARLNKWLLRYITSDDSVDQDTKARFPLREARVKIAEHPGKPGSYQCVMHLRPHFQLDQVVATIRLATELAPRSGRG